jgi:hypothetical protein
MATIITKFELGQEVWGIASAYATRIVFCQTCKREGIVTIGGETFTCPKCNGLSKHPMGVGSRWYVSEHSTIGKCSTEYYLRPELGDETRHSYMIESTGIGSGRIWIEDDLFGSEADALAECAKRNSGMSFEDDK